MAKCPSCGAENDVGAVDCLGCGVALASGSSKVVRLRLIPPTGGEGSRFELVPGEYLLGRDPEASLRLDDPFVSPRHARLQVGETVRITDLGSATGLFARLRSPVELLSGDEFRFGQECLLFEALPRPAGAVGGGRVWGSADKGSRFRLSRLLEGGGTGEAITLGEGECLLGRDEGAMIFPGDLAVSGRQATLDVAGAKVTLCDHGSANGTFVRIRSERELSPGDQILLGQHQLRLEA